jgi:hypothetical protein
MDLKSLILTAEDLKKETVEVPEWGTTVTVQELTAEGREELETYIRISGGFADSKQVRAIVAAFTIVDETGKRVFTCDDIPALAKKNGKALARIFVKAKSLSGLFDEDEAIEKN